MELQNFERKNERIRQAFEELKRGSPEKLSPRLALSWSNWGFGMEPLAESARRLEQAGIRFIELHGNHLVVPAAVGRPAAYDAMEFDRSVETLRLAADRFVEHRVKAAVEPIRSAETSIVHTVAEARRYIETVNHPGVGHINGDVYHMQVEEPHIGEALLEAGELLTNLHLADSNRGALGEGSLDRDTVLRALYLIGYNREGCYLTPEPLGPGADPYPAMYGRPDPALLGHLVNQTARYFREREEKLLG